MKIENESKLSRPLVLEFSATAPEVGITQGGSLVLRSSPLPLNLGARYTGLPRRSTGMVVPYAPAQEAEIALSLRSTRFTEVPKSETIDSPFGTFVREVAEGGVGDRRIVLRYTSTLRTGVVEASRYAELAAFTRRVEAVEQALIRAGS